MNFLKIKNSERYESLLSSTFEDISAILDTSWQRENVHSIARKFGPNNNLVLYAKLSKFESHLCQTVKK